MNKNIWFTAEHHFGHANIIRFCNRPFADVDAMNESLIANWNSVVTPKGTVYHLGDLFLVNREAAQAIRNRLNGSICLVRGNHDKTADSLKGVFEWVKDYYELSVPDEGASGGKQHIVLCHYALRVWNRMRHGAWHLYGHSHGTLPTTPGQRSFDVGVDCHYGRRGRRM